MKILSLSEVGVLCQIQSEFSAHSSPVRSALIVLPPPRFDNLFGLTQRHEPMRVGQRHQHEAAASFAQLTGRVDRC
jgi:hypothetical protein